MRGRAVEPVLQGGRVERDRLGADVDPIEHVAVPQVHVIGEARSLDPGDDDRAVGPAREGRAERGDAPGAVEGPEPDGLVGRAGGEPAAVGRLGQGVDRPLVTGEVAASRAPPRSRLKIAIPPPHPTAAIGALAPRRRGGAGNRTTSGRHARDERALATRAPFGPMASSAKGPTGRIDHPARASPRRGASLPAFESDRLAIAEVESLVGAIVRAGGPSREADRRAVGGEPHVPDAGAVAAKLGRSQVRAVQVADADRLRVAPRRR